VVAQDLLKQVMDSNCSNLITEYKKIKITKMFIFLFSLFVFYVLSTPAPTAAPIHSCSSGFSATYYNQTSSAGYPSYNTNYLLACCPSSCKTLPCPTPYTRSGLGPNAPNYWGGFDTIDNVLVTGPNQHQCITKKRDEDQGVNNAFDYQANGTAYVPPGGYKLDALAVIYLRLPDFSFACSPYSLRDIGIFNYGICSDGFPFLLNISLFFCFQLPNCQSGCIRVPRDNNPTPQPTTNKSGSFTGYFYRDEEDE